VAAGDNQKTRAGRANARDSSASQDGGRKRLRLPLKTTDQIKAELARLYREGKSRQRDVGEVSKLAHVLGILGRRIEADEYAARIAALEEKMQATGGLDS
jgi:hypothetical protein